MIKNLNLLIVFLFFTNFSFSQSVKNKSESGPFLPPEIMMIFPSTTPYATQSNPINIVVNVNNIQDEKEVEFRISQKTISEPSSVVANESNNIIKPLRVQQNKYGFELSYTVALKDGINEFEIKAKNRNDEVKKTIKINNSVFKLSKVWAVIVGVSKYKDPSLNLKYSSSDAMDVYDFLRSPVGGTVPEDQITLLLDEKATRATIINSIEKKLNRAFEDDRVLLYFAGHGTPHPERNELFFMCYDADLSNLSGTAVSQSEIDNILKYNNAKQKIWITDICHAGSTKLSYRGDEIAQTNKLLREISLSKEGYIVMAASSESEKSLERDDLGGGHGVFTYYLIEGLKGAANTNNDEWIRIGELYEYVFRKVAEATDGKQHPKFSGKYDNDLPMSKIK